MNHEIVRCIKRYEYFNNIKDEVNDLIKNVGFDANTPNQISLQNCDGITNWHNGIGVPKGSEFSFQHINSEIVGTNLSDLFDDFRYRFI